MLAGRADEPDGVPPSPPSPSPPPARGLRIQPQTLWLAAAIAAALVVAWVVITGAASSLILLFVAIVLAEGLRPLVRWLSSHGVPRPLAVLLLYVLVIGGLGALLWLLLSPLLQQIVTLVNEAPRYIADIQRLIKQAQRFVSHNPQATYLLNALGGQANRVVSSLLPVVLNTPLLLAGMLFKGIQILLVAFFWLTAIDGLTEFVLGLLPAQAQPTAARALSELSRKLGGYVRGVVINTVLIGVLSGGGLLLLGVPYPLLLGVLAGLAETLPFIGPWISGTPAVLLALILNGPLKAVEVVLLYTVIQQVEGNVVVPLVMNRSVHLNPLSVIVGVLIGGALFGLVGAVLGVPAAVVVQVAVVEILAPLARRASARVSPRVSPPSMPAAARPPVPTGPTPREADPSVVAGARDEQAR